VRRGLPLVVLVVVTVLDLAAGRDQQTHSLTVIAPLVAATTLGRRATAAYAVAALAITALLGVYDNQYTAETVLAQAARLAGVAIGGGLALVACTLRLRREEELARVTAQATANRAVVQLADTLQRNLLGEPPRVAGLETAVRYVPAARHARVGGDWYDAFPLPDGRTTLVIGDVAGHDAPAAATMAETRGMLRALAQSVAGSPAEMLRALDTAFANLGMDTLVTVLVATIDSRFARTARQVVLCWSNAGHPAPVLVRADGTTELLERTPNRLLGVGAGSERIEHRLPLDPGDTIVFYTDGLVERRHLTLDDGTERLVRELRRIGREPLNHLCDELLASMDGRIDDDIALLAIRIPAGAAA
jgi:phosphoserine phosphatase RsbU/P